MKKFDKIMVKIRANVFAVKAGVKSVIFTWRDFRKHYGELQILTRTEQKTWCDNVFIAYYQNEYFKEINRLIRKELEREFAM